MIGKIPAGADQISITAQQARELEVALGLERGALESKNVISVVEDIAARSPRRPLSGNTYFLGEGKGLPGGGPEVLVDSIPSGGGPGIKQIILEVHENGK